MRIWGAIGYLTHTIQFNIPIIYDKKVYLQCQCNVNVMFKMKKIHEKNDIVKPVEKKKRIKQDIKIRNGEMILKGVISVFQSLTPTPIKLIAARIITSCIRLGIINPFIQCYYSINSFL